jgi:peroxidase
MQRPQTVSASLPSCWLKDRLPRITFVREHRRFLSPFSSHPRGIPMKKASYVRRFRALRLEKLQARELMAIDLAGLLRPGDLATYSSDGTNNNPLQAEWGSTNERLLRLAKPEYGDSISTPGGSDRPSARVISNAVADQGDMDIISDRNLSAFTYVWGQFIDHDIGLTPTGTTESMSIAIPSGDPYFDPLATGSKAIHTSRSKFDPTTGTSADNPREQINTITAWLDGSMIYGSDTATATALRTMSGGKLKIGADGLLPVNNATNFPSGTLPMANDARRVPDHQMLAAGDVRANENIELTSLHSLFVREHNRWADRLAAMNPRLTDSQLYLRARAIVIGEIQSITYNEWLPALLGPAGLTPYRGYNRQVNPGLSNEFSTAGFRFGHSLLGNDVEFLNDAGRPVADEIELKDAFFNPTALQGKTIDSIFKYLASDPSSELDTMVVGGVRNFLFGQPGAGGFDLASLNIQRGRDHGLADYNDVRAALGLPRVRSFADITRDASLQSKLQTLYGNVDNIDLWVGALSEDRLPGASVGPTVARIIVDQFQRIRNGDRFWYQNAFTGQLLRDIDNTRLGDVLQRNTRMTNLQQNVFVFQASLEGTVFFDRNSDRRRNFGEDGLPGWTVALIDSANETVATVVTDRLGRYRFDVQSGVRTDNYRIRVVVDPAGRAIVGGIESTASITRGDQNLRGLDLAVTRNAPGTQTAARNASSAIMPTEVPLASSDSIDQAQADLTRRRRAR